MIGTVPIRQPGEARDAAQAAPAPLASVAEDRNIGADVREDIAHRRFAQRTQRPCLLTALSAVAENTTQYRRAVPGTPLLQAMLRVGVWKPHHETLRTCATFASLLAGCKSRRAAA